MVVVQGGLIQCVVCFSERVYYEAEVKIIRLKQLSIEYLAKATGQSEKTIAKDIERDFYMSAKDALEYGVIDQVMEARK